MSQYQVKSKVTAQHLCWAFRENGKSSRIFQTNTGWLVIAH